MGSGKHQFLRNVNQVTNSTPSAFPNPIIKAFFTSSRETSLPRVSQMDVTAPPPPPGITAAWSAGSRFIRIEPCWRNAPETLRCALPMIFLPFTRSSYHEGEEKQEGSFAFFFTSPACLFERETISALMPRPLRPADRKSTRLNSSHQLISYAVFCLK